MPRDRRPKGKVLDPSFPKQEENYKFDPCDTVYVPVCVIDLLDRPCYQTCNVAYENFEDAASHFWFREPDKTIMDEMTVKDYLSQYDKKGMNPFHTLNIIEFFQRWDKENASNN